MSETASAIDDAGWIVGSGSGHALLLTDANFPMPMLTISGTTVTEGNSGTTNAVFTVRALQGVMETTGAAIHRRDD